MSDASCSFSFVDQTTMKVSLTRPTVSSNPYFRQEILFADETIGVDSVTYHLAKTDTSANFPVTIGHSYSVSYMYFYDSGTGVDSSYQLIKGQHNGISNNYSALVSTYPKPAVFVNEASFDGLDSSDSPFITLSMNFPDDGYDDLLRTFIKITDMSNHLSYQTVIQQKPTQITAPTSATPGVYENFTITYNSSNPFPGMTLNKDYRYDVTVDVANANGSSTLSGTKAIEKSFTPSSKVNPPRSLESVVSTKSNATPFVTLSWLAPNGTAPSSYNVFRYITGTDTSNNGIFIRSTTGLSITDTSVTEGKTYTYQVRSVNSSGNESVHTPSGSVTPVIQLPAATGFTAVQRTDGSFNLEWNVIPNANANHYTIGFADDASSTRVQLTTGTTAGAYITLSPIALSGNSTKYQALVTDASNRLTSGKAYTFSVFGNITGSSFGSNADSLEATASVTYYKLPGQFGANQITIKNAGSGMVDLSWNSPALNNFPVTSFLIYAFPGTNITKEDLVEANKINTVPANANQHSYYLRQGIANGTWSFAIIPSNNGFAKKETDSNNSKTGVIIKAIPTYPDPVSATVAWDLSNSAQFVFDIVPPSSSTLLANGLKADESIKYALKGYTDLSNTPTDPSFQQFTQDVSLNYNSTTKQYSVSKDTINNYVSSIISPVNLKKINFTVDASYSTGVSTGIKTQGITLYASTDFSGVTTQYDASMQVRLGTDKTAVIDWNPYTKFTADKGHISVTGYKLVISGSSIAGENQTYTLGSNQTEKTLTLTNGMYYTAKVSPIVSNSDPNAITPIPSHNIIEINNSKTFVPYVQATAVRDLSANQTSLTQTRLTWVAPLGGYGVNKSLTGYNFYVNNIYTLKISDSSLSYQHTVTTGELNKFGIIPLVTDSMTTHIVEEGTMTEVSFATLETLTMNTVIGTTSNGFNNLSWTALNTTTYKGYSNISYDIYQNSLLNPIANTSGTSFSTNLNYSTNAELKNGDTVTYKVVAKANSVNDSTNTKFIKSGASNEVSITYNNNKVLGVAGLTAQQVELTAADNEVDAIKISWTVPSPHFMNDSIFKKYIVKVNGVDVSSNLISKDLSVSTNGATLLGPTSATNNDLVLSNSNFANSHMNGTNNVFVKIIDLSLNFGTAYDVAVTIVDSNNVAGAVASTTVTPSFVGSLPTVDSLTLKSSTYNDANKNWVTVWTLKAKTNGSKITDGFMMITPEVYSSLDDLVTSAPIPSGFIISNTFEYKADFTFTTISKSTRTPFFVLANSKGLVTNITSTNSSNSSA